MKSTIKWQVDNSLGSIVSYCLLELLSLNRCPSCLLSIFSYISITKELKMGSNQGEESIMHNRQQELQKLLQLTGALTVHAALTVAIELNLFEIIAKSGPNAQLSSAQIVSRLPTKNPDAPVVLDRILQLLSSYSILKCTLCNDQKGHTTKLFGLTPMGEYLVPDSNGISFAPAILMAREKAFANCGCEIFFLITFSNMHKITF